MFSTKSVRASLLTDPSSFGGNGSARLERKALSCPSSPQTWRFRPVILHGPASWPRRWDVFAQTGDIWTGIIRRPALRVLAQQQPARAAPSCQTPASLSGVGEQHRMFEQPDGRVLPQASQNTRGEASGRSLTAAELISMCC